MTDDHRYLSLRPHGLLFSLPVSVRTTLAEQSVESDSESHGKGMNKSWNTLDHPVTEIS